MKRVTHTALGALLLTGAAAAQEASQFEVWHPRRPANEADYVVAKWGPRALPSPGYAFRAAKVLP